MTFPFQPLSLIFCSALAVAVPSRTEERRVPMAMGEKLVVRQRHAGVQIEGWDSPEMVLLAEYRDGRHNFTHLKAEVQIRRVAGGLEVSVNGPTGGFGYVQLPQCSLILKVPRKLDLDLHSQGGEVNLRGVEGRLNCATDRGNLHLEHLAGIVSVETNHGRLSARNLKASLWGRAKMGAVTLEQVTGAVDVEARDGGLEAIDLDGGGAGIRLRTRNGRLHVRLGHAKGTLDIRTHGGTISTKGLVLEQLSSTAKRLTGKIPGSPQVISLETRGGHIEVD